MNRLSLRKTASQLAIACVIGPQLGRDAEVSAEERRA